MLLGARLRLAAALPSSCLRFMTLMLSRFIGLPRLWLGRLPRMVIMLLPRMRIMFPMLMLAEVRLAAWPVFNLVLPRLRNIGPICVLVVSSTAAWLVLLSMLPRMRIVDLVCMLACLGMAAWPPPRMVVRVDQVP